MRPVSGIEKFAGSGLSAVAKLKPMTRLLEKGYKNPEAFAVTMLVTSLVSKDAVNCYYYVTQSLHNEKIPEDKRKFVAALDGMNGVMNVVGQILITMLAEKALSKYVFNKLIASKLDDDTLAVHAKKIVESSAQKLDIEKVKAALLKKNNSVSTRYKGLETGLRVLLGFLMTAAFAKRVLTPLIATPLAGWFKDKYMKDDPKKAKSKEVKAKDNKKDAPKPNLDDQLLSHETAPWNKTPNTIENSKLNKIS